MAKLTVVQRRQKQIERLQQTRLILLSKLELIQAALADIDETIRKLDGPST